MALVRALVSLYLALVLHVVGMATAVLLPLILRLLAPDPQPMSLIEVELIESPPASASAVEPFSPAISHPREEGRAGRGEHGEPARRVAEFDVVVLEPPPAPEPPAPVEQPKAKAAKADTKVKPIAALSEAGLLAILGSSHDSTADNVLSGGSVGDLDRAMRASETGISGGRGGLYGSEIGTSEGYGGLGAVATGKGRGGAGMAGGGSLRAGDLRFGDGGRTGGIAGLGSASAPKLDSTTPSLTVTVGAVRLDSGVGDRSSIASALQRMRPRFRACYRRAVEVDPSLQGHITLRFKVSEEGRAGDVRTGTGGDEPEPGEITNESLVRCVKGAVGAATFSSGERDTGVTTVIHFSAQPR